MRPSPALLAFVEMLALPAVALDELVERELADNPALERGDDRGPSAGPHEVAAPASRRDELLADVRASLPSRDRDLAEYVVESLDERGFLDADLREVADVLGVEPDRIERVVQAVREVGPPGIAARDLRESLLFQLDRLGSRNGAVVGLARRCVEQHLEDLGGRRDLLIARALDATPSEVAAARELIRSRLRPRCDLGAPSHVLQVVADFVITQRPDSLGVYDVELPEAGRCGLALNSLYELLAREGGHGLSESERARVAAQVEQARAFIDRVERRRRTLLRVAQLVVERQASFLRCGPAALVPLTRADVAAELGLHESTVCRAVSGRFVRLPAGRTVPFAQFFRRSLGAEEALTELVAHEHRPRSDAELAEELAARGFKVARRTVAKYRDRLGILPYALR